MNLKKQIQQLLRRKPNRNQQYELFQQLYAYENSGIGTLNAIYDLYQDEQNTDMKAILKQIWQELNHAATISEAFERTKAFPEFIIIALRSGDEHGKLDEMYEKIAAHIEQEDEINNKIQEAFYPLIYGGIGVVVAFYVLANVIVPKVENMFLSRKLDMPALLQFVFSIVHFVQDYWVILLLSGLGIYRLVLWFQRKYTFIIDRWKFKMPIYRNLYRAIVQYRFVQMFAMMDAAGAGHIKSLEFAAGVTQNALMQDTAKKAILLITKKGVSITEAIELSDRSKIIDLRVLSFLKTGEKSGRIDQTFNKLGFFYDRRVRRKVKKFSTEIGALVLVSLLGIVLFMYFILMLAQSSMFKAAVQAH